MQDDGVFAAARGVRGYLTELVGPDAETLDAELANILNGGERNDESAAQLRSLLSERPETRMFLDVVLDDVPYFRPHTIKGLDPVRGFDPLPGDHSPPSAMRFRCPVGDDFDWWSPGVGAPVPKCGTHDVALTADSQGS